MLETSECVLIHNTNNRSYTDCMEWTLLRFMQLMLYDQTTLIDGKMKYVLPSEYDLKISEEINSYILKNNIIHIDTEYYESEKGIIERTEWVKLMSDHQNLFDYYRNDKAELFTNVFNIILFCEHFFGIKCNEENDFTETLSTESDDFFHKNIQQSFNVIAEYFTSLTGKNISFQILNINKKKYELTMGELCRLLSKEDEKLTDPKIRRKIFSANNKTTNIQIEINQEKYLWTLMEYYLDHKYAEFKNKFITGHSVINKI